MHLILRVIYLSASEKCQENTDRIHLSPCINQYVRNKPDSGAHALVSPWIWFTGSTEKPGAKRRQPLCVVMCKRAAQFTALWWAQGVTL